MRLKEFMDNFMEAAQIACCGSLEPQIIIRRADGSEFSPVKIKASVGRIIICEDKNG